MRSVLIAALAALLLLPAGAAAQSAPFAPLPEPAPEQPAPAPAPTDGSTQDDGISTTAQLLVIVGGLLFVVGVGVAIAVDARRNAPADPRPGRSGARSDDIAEGVPGERKKRERRQQEKHKAAAKRSRQARKKNRPVRK